MAPTSPLVSMRPNAPPAAMARR